MAIIGSSGEASPVCGLKTDEKDSLKSISHKNPMTQSGEMASSYELILKLRLNVEELTELVDRLSFITREIRYLMK